MGRSIAQYAAGRRYAPPKPRGAEGSREVRAPSRAVREGPYGGLKGVLCGDEKEPLGATPGTVPETDTGGRAEYAKATEEFASRNSANCMRNFGISMAPARGPQRNGPCDCLPKTQVRANQRWEVCGLTPARYRKVKGSRQRKRSGEPKPRQTAAVTITVLR